MCLYPKLIHNAKYKPNKKNGGHAPPITDPRVIYVPIGCGQCIECTKKKAREWQVRLLEEIKHTQNGYFVTLTFSNEAIADLSKDVPNKGYQLDNYIAKTAVRRFLERWRKEHGVSLKHWLITELGHNGTENIHLHGIIWFNDKKDILQLDTYWKYGFTWKGTAIKEKNNITGYANYVNETTVAYIIKYVTKRDNLHKYYKPIVLTSPGIGKQYTETQAAKRNEYNEEQTKETYKTQTGHDISMPIYYRNKIYTEQEREQLWLLKLDKQERWILGQKVNINETPELYLEMLKNAREKNKRLGYADDKIDYNQKEYENQIRKIMQETRIKKAKNNASGGASGGG